MRNRLRSFVFFSGLLLVLPVSAVPNKPFPTHQTYLAGTMKPTVVSQA